MDLNSSKIVTQAKSSLIIESTPEFGIQKSILSVKFRVTGYFKSLNNKSGKPRDLRVIKFYFTLSFILKQVLLIAGYSLNVYHLH